MKMTRDDMAEAIEELRTFGKTLVFGRTDYADVYDGIPVSERYTASVEFSDGQYTATVTQWQTVPDPVFMTAWEPVTWFEHKARGLADLLYTLNRKYGIVEREW